MVRRPDGVGTGRGGRSAPSSRPGGTSFLEEHSLAIAFVLAVGCGLFGSIQVLRLALGESRMAHLEGERAARCRTLMSRSLEGTHPFEPEDVPPEAEELALRRSELRDLVRRGKLRQRILCPEQGPMRDRDDHHYRLVLTGEGEVELRCRLHGGLDR